MKTQSSPPVSKRLTQATLIGLPTDVGASRLGAAMGPDALRVAQLAPALERLGVRVNDLGNLSGPPNPRGARDMQGLRVLITAGPTCENIDPVRFITNRSSGKMGYALAEAALRRGAQVTLVTGPVSLTPPQGAQVEPVRTTEDLLQRMLALAPEQDIVIQAAAPADDRAQQIAPQKLKKQGDGALTLTFVPTPDVAKAVGEGKHDGQILVGFAAETETAVENARKKLDSKHLDMIVANDVTQPGAGFDVDTNIATIITHQQAESLPIMTKKALADEILTRALALRG